MGTGRFWAAQYMVKKSGTRHRMAVHLNATGSSDAIEDAGCVHRRRQYRARFAACSRYRHDAVPRLYGKAGHGYGRRSGPGRVDQAVRAAVRWPARTTVFAPRRAGHAGAAAGAPRPCAFFPLPRPAILLRQWRRPGLCAVDRHACGGDHTRQAERRLPGPHRGPGKRRRRRPDRGARCRRCWPAATIAMRCGNRCSIIAARWETGWC